MKADKTTKSAKGSGRALISLDYAMKSLLRNKANYDVLEGFLSELLGRDVKVRSISESESNRRREEDKYNRVDILVEDEKKELIIIELQFDSETDYFHRMLFGTSKAITDYMGKGDDYNKVRKVYSINIVYFDLGQGRDYVYHGQTSFVGMHVQDVLQLSAMQRKVFAKNTPEELYPEYYILKINNFNDVAKNSLDEWIYFLKNDKIKADFSAKGLAKARDILAYNKLSPSERQEYDNLQAMRRGSRATLTTAKAEGEFEGERRGMEKGLAKGMEKGRHETKIEMVVNFYRLKVSVDDIATGTGMTQAQVQEILKQHQLM